MVQLSFSTFWQGERLSPYEMACLSSFAACGYEVNLYSFDQIVNVPEGVALCDAAAIVEHRAADAFLINGKPSLSHFSDYFRYRLFALHDTAWIDADMMLLKPFELPSEQPLFAREEATSICGAIMHIPRGHSSLPALISRTEAMMGRNMRWGDSGPRLLSSHFGETEIMDTSAPPEVFFPIHYSEFWKVFLPQFREECTALCEAAKTLHLWNNLIDKCGIWKMIGPPPGSFLQEVMLKSDCIRFFSDFYPAEVLTNVVENFVARGGEGLGAREWFRLLLPSLRNTMRRRVKHDYSLLLERQARPTLRQMGKGKWSPK